MGFNPQEHGNYNWDDFKGLDLRDQIVLVVSGNAPSNFATEAMIRGALGVLWIVGEGRDDVRSQIQFANPEEEYLRRPNLPVFRIRPQVANQILSVSNLNILDAFSDKGEFDQSGPGWFTRQLETKVSMHLNLGDAEEFQVPSVLGYLPGSDFDLSRELIILYVTYDSLGIDPDGTEYPGANHNATGVGLLLEIARLWQQQGLSPRRTVLFAAWGGATLDDSGASAWPENVINFRHLRTESISRNTSPAIVIQLDYVGAGGEELLIHPDSSNRLFDLFQETNEEGSNMSILVDVDTPEFTNDIISIRFPTWISIKWSGEPLLPTEDVIGNIDLDKLQDLGQLLALVLTKLARETTY